MLLLKRKPYLIGAASALCEQLELRDRYNLLLWVLGWQAILEDNSTSLFIAYKGIN